MWCVWVEDDVVVREHGVRGGKLVVSRRRVTPKRVGTRGETSASEQARAEALQLWMKQRNKGYAPEDAGGEGEREGEGDDPETVEAEARSATATVAPVVGVIRPMLAEKVTNLTGPRGGCPKYLSWDAGVHVQPKLDGWRCLAAQTEDGGVVLTTRTGKPYPHFTHLKEAVGVLWGLMKQRRLPGTPLDGEVYTHAFRSRPDAFSLIQSMCGVRRRTPHPEECKLQLWIFDVVAEGAPQTARTDLLRTIAQIWRGAAPPDLVDVLQFVPTTVVNTPARAKALHDAYVADGYEGAMLRAHNGIYLSGREGKPQRSQYLRKYKQFDDGEFTIVGHKRAVGTEEGCVVWVCCLPSGDTFDVRPCGSFTDRRLEHPERMYGAPLLVRYQGVSADGKPRFPRGVAVREECESVVVPVPPPQGGGSVKREDTIGVFAQAATRASLKTLVECLRSVVPPVPVAAENLGAVLPKHVKEAHKMGERDPRYAVILAFDVEVTAEARAMADATGVTIFTADIKYHLTDQFDAHMDRCAGKGKPRGQRKK